MLGLTLKLTSPSIEGILPGAAIVIGDWALLSEVNWQDVNDTAWKGWEFIEIVDGDWGLMSTHAWQDVNLTNWPDWDAASDS